MTDELRGEIRNLLNGIEADPGEIDAATSDRLHRRFEALARPDLASPSETTFPTPPHLVPLDSGLIELTDLPRYGEDDAPRHRGRRAPVVVSATALAAAALLVAVLLPSWQSSAVPKPDLMLADVLAPVRAATDTPLSRTDVITQVMTIRSERDELSRVQTLRADGSGEETVLDKEGEILAHLSDQGPSTYRFGPFTYDELRSLPTDPAELAQIIDSPQRTATATERTGVLAEIAASPVAPPAVRAAALEVLSIDGFAWRLDRAGLIIGARGTRPSEQVAVDPATGRALAYGWVEEADDPLLDAARVTIWR